MNSRVTEDFILCYARLPANVRELARRAYRLWRSNPSHPGIQFKRTSGFTQRISYFRPEWALDGVRRVHLKGIPSSGSGSVRTPSTTPSCLGSDISWGQSRGRARGDEKKVWVLEWVVLVERLVRDTDSAVLAGSSLRRLRQRGLFGPGLTALRYPGKPRIN